MGPRNRFPGNEFASLCSLAGRYDNSIPTCFLALTDCSKIPAQESGQMWEILYYDNDDLTTMTLSGQCGVYGGQRQTKAVINGTWSTDSTSATL